MHSLKLFAVATLALGFAGSASAAPTLDASGKCRDKGKFVAASMCKPPAPGKCRDAKSKKFVKCGTPGAEPVPAKK